MTLRSRARASLVNLIFIKETVKAVTVHVTIRDKFQLRFFHFLCNLLKIFDCTLVLDPIKTNIKLKAELKILQIHGRPCRRRPSEEKVTQNQM